MFALVMMILADSFRLWCKAKTHIVLIETKTGISYKLEIKREAL